MILKFAEIMLEMNRRPVFVQEFVTDAGQIRLKHVAWCFYHCDLRSLFLTHDEVLKVGSRRLAKMRREKEKLQKEQAKVEEVKAKDPIPALLAKYALAHARGL